MKKVFEMAAEGLGLLQMTRCRGTTIGVIGGIYGDLNVLSDLNVLKDLSNWSDWRISNGNDHKSGLCRYHWKNSNEKELFSAEGGICGIFIGNYPTRARDTAKSSFLIGKNPIGTKE